MFRFIHSADWQLGARFSQFGTRGPRLREVRIVTLRRALGLAREHAVDAFLIAGDLFEDNQVDDALVSAVLELFREHASVPIFILPGNHDPFTGPDSVRQRKAVLAAPAHVRVLQQPAVVDLGGALLLASPLQQKTITATLVPSAADLERSSSELEADEAQQAEAIPAAEKNLKTFDKTLAHSRAAMETLQKLTAAAGEHRTRLHTLESQAADLSARYPEGLEKAKARAQVEFTRAEARAVAIKASLPPDFEKLPERNKRAATALQQLANELQASRSERDNARGALEILGGQGIYSRETELEEKKVEATLRRDAARTRGWAARIGHTLIEHRKQAATRAVLTPLEQRLTAAFAELTGDRAREVFLDEHLQIAGIGRTRAESHAFDLLSQGAKEQLLLCLRIAVAQELATAEPQVLILDDVLVNTDRARQERVLDALSGLSEKLQVIVLTSHADRYRGIGQSLAIVPTAVAPQEK